MTTVGSTNNTSTTSSTSTTSAATSQASFGTNFNTFLTMLTTQLKNQDPLSPMDSSQFTNQLVQFSSVEQQINANSNLEKLIALQQTAQTSSGINYLGQTVEISGTDLPLQDGAATFTYTLPKAANTAAIQIRDSGGTLVKTITGDTTTGAHTVNWDGKDSDGNQLADGKYTINVVASAADGSTLTPTTTTFGKITKVVNDATNGTELVMAAGTKGDTITTTMSKVVSVADNSSSVSSAQLSAANAQYQAAQAQLKALEAAASSSTSSSSSSGQ